MTSTPPVDLAEVLRPCAPPIVIEDVYTAAQYEAIVEVVERRGPWQTIIGQHFETVDEMVATITGVVPEDHGMELDHFTGPLFRGFLAQNSTLLYPELFDAFYNERFVERIKAYWGCEYARPTMMLFNISGPNDMGSHAHLDAVTFRGVRIENTPVWLQNVMAKSGLFTDHLVKMGQIITWWWRGEEGTFTYWPDGPHQPPQRLEHPLWNKGVVVQNELMFHRGDSQGRPEERSHKGVRARSLLHHDAAADEWVVTTDGDEVLRYRPDQMRLLVHWNAELYADEAELHKVMDHTDDLTHQQVVDTLLADLRARGVTVAEPTDPFHDVDWIQALIHTYTIAPTTDWRAG